MIFKDKENQYKYLKYSENETSKTRHFKLNTNTLEQLNELTTVTKKRIEYLNINSSIIANLIFDLYFKSLENKNDNQILKEIEQNLLKYYKEL